MTVSANGFSSVFSRGQVRDAFLCHLLLVVAGWRVVGVDDVIVGGAVGGVLLSRFDGVRAGNLQQHLGLSEKGKHLYTTQSQCFERSFLMLPFTLPLCQSGFSHVVVLRTPHSSHLEPVIFPAAAAGPEDLEIGCISEFYTYGNQ